MPNPSEHIRAELLGSYGSFLDENPTLFDILDGELSAFNLRVRRELDLKSPYLLLGKSLREAESAFPNLQDHAMAWGGEWEDYAVFWKLANLPEGAYWQRQFQSAKAKSPKGCRLSHKHFLLSWRRSFDQVSAAWEMEYLQRLRAEFLARLVEWLSLLKELSQLLEGAGMAPGIFFDFSPDEVSFSNIEEIKRWLAYISQDEAMRRLCDLMGRLRQAEVSIKREMIEKIVDFKTSLPDVNSRQEIIGIKLGREIAHMLPSELALMSHTDTAQLFDLKFVENRLMCFDMGGLSASVDKRTQREERQSKEEEKRGPIIICVDTSGSMQGMPETVAKAMTLYLTLEARKDKRPCYLINFSTGIETFDFSEARSFGELLKFLRKSFSGGTDALPALSHGLSQMLGEKYRRADLLMVSDFIMPGMPAELSGKIDALRAEGNRFYALIVGDQRCAQFTKTNFDRGWIFNPGNSTITELAGYRLELSENLRADESLR